MDIRAEGSQGVKMLRLPPTVGVKLQLKISESIAHDGSQLEWLSVSEGSSEEYSGDESNYSEESESILISDTDQQLLFKGDLVKSNKIRDSIALFENGQQDVKNSQKNNKSYNLNTNLNIREKINRFNTPNDRRKSSIHSHDSGVSSTGLTTSASSFNSRSISLTSNSNSEGEDLKNRNFQKSRKSRSNSARRNTIRSASTTSIDRSSVGIRSVSSGRMSRGAEKERIKLQKLMNGTFMKNLTPKRSRSQDGILDTRTVKSELKTVEHQERARAAIRKEKLNKKRWQSEPRTGLKKSAPIPAHTPAPTVVPNSSRYEVDQNKNEIRLTLPEQLQLEKLVNIKAASKVPEIEPEIEKSKQIKITRRSGGKGQTIILEERETTNKMKQGAQVTNKPLRQIQLTEFQPFCFEILHKNGRPISNLFIMPSDDSEFSFSIPRIRLMVECNRMRYFANFHPQQRMEHLKTLIYVLTGVMPRNQCLFYRQRMDSKLPFEGLLEGDYEEVVQAKENLTSDLAQFMSNENNVLRLHQSSTSSISLAASSDEAYGSDKSISGDDGIKRGRELKSIDGKNQRSRSSDVRAGKFLNKLRGQKFSGLRPEDFNSNTGELKESDFFTSYMVLLKDRRLSDEEHDARCDLLSYMQTKMDSYNWKIIRQFHDQVIKYWERGLVCFDADLESFKRHYFDGHPSKMKKTVYKPVRPPFARNIRRSTQRIVY